MSGPMLRRFLWPLAALIALPAVVAIIVAATQWNWHSDEMNFGAFAWITIGALVLSIAGCAWFLSRLARALARETISVLTTAVPASAPRDPQGDVLQQVAQKLSELMTDASKDQAQLRTIISSMSDGLIATDHEQRILLTNDAAAELLAFRIPSGAPARGQLLFDILPIDPVLKAVTEISLTGQSMTVPVGPVANRYLEVTVCRLPLRPAGFIIVAHDVTETMRYEELRKEFVANVSHELRTPLTVIRGYVETLQDGAVDDRPRAMQYLATVQKHTQQLTNLVNDLLNLSRLDSMAAIADPTPVSLKRIAKRVADLHAPAAQLKNHTLTVHATPATVRGDGEQLERAVSNLVENAIKYTRAGGNIGIVVHSDGASAIIEVTDNGIGIAADDVPRIFERFYRADRSRSREMGGTGLGLSIVKHIVQAHGGTIDVTSAPGQGSTFRMRFPATEDSNGENGNDASASEVAA